jgi:hypothetical protein
MVAQDGGPYGRTLVAQSAGEENFRFTPIRPAAAATEARQESHLRPRAGLRSDSN